MILIDTPVWIDHFRSGDARLKALLEQGEVLTHPVVIGELALGNLRQRTLVLGLLGDLPSAPRVEDAEILALIDSQALAGSGIGYADVHLLAATRLQPGARLWTRDRRLREVARRLDVAAPE